MFIDLII